MVMEYCNLGNISRIQKEKTGKVYTLSEASKIISEVIDGLEHMHSKNIIHRDIKPENILLTKNDNDEVETKICDLGFSR